MTFPTIAAHILGQLMKFMGEDRIVFGSDSVWYGSPQWQIEALWRFQIPEELRKKYGYPELTERGQAEDPGAELGQAVRHQGRGHRAQYRAVPKDYESRMTEELKTLLEFAGYTADNMSRVRETYLAMGAEPSNTRYGWIRTGG